MADIVASSPVARTVNLARSTVSSGIFGLGRGGAASSGPAQPTQKLIDTNDLSLRLISNQLSSLTAQMNDIGGALERIAFYIAQDTSLEQVQNRQEQAQEKQLAEEGIRTRQESVIERKLKAALIAPVQAVAQRAQSVLQRLMQFFGTLLGGWLIMRGIDTLKALATGNTKKLEEIRDSIIKNLAIAGGVLLAVNGGFFALAGILASITLKITKALGKLIFIKPFQFIAKLVGDAIKNIVKPGAKVAAEGTEAAVKAGTKAATKEGAEAATKAGAKGLLGGLGKSATRLLPFANIPISGAFAYQNLKEGDIPGAALDIAGMIPGPIGWAALAAGIGYETATGGGIKMKPQSTSQPTGPKVSSGKGGTVTPGVPYPATLGGKQGTVTYDAAGKKTFTPSAAQPQTPMAPNITQFQFGADTTGQFSNVFSGEDQDFSQPPTYGDVKIPTEDLISGSPTETPTQAQITPMPVAQMQQRMEQVASPLPEPKPTLTMLRTSSGQQGGMGNQAPPVGGPANSVPAISSSNPENFYTLYSQVHYNVVM